MVVKEGDTYLNRIVLNNVIDDQHLLVTPSTPPSIPTMLHQPTIHRPPIRRDSITLSDYYSDNDPNDLDFNEVTKMSQYREAIEIIQRKCEALSRDNEKLVRRLHCVKKVTKQKERDVSLLKARLDLFNDEWRTAQPEPTDKFNYPSLIENQNKPIKKQKIRKNNKNSQQQNSNIANDENSGSKIGNAGGKTGKRKRMRGEKPEKDPNAPKRPANPFFQFCQEQRAIVMEELNSEMTPGQPELSKQELTKQLANRWRAMSNETKQIYINKYESSKQKYNQEMQFYKRDNGGGSSGSSSVNITTAGGSAATN